MSSPMNESFDTDDIIEAEHIKQVFGPLGDLEEGQAFFRVVTFRRFPSPKAEARLWWRATFKKIKSSQLFTIARVDLRWWALLLRVAWLAWGM